MSNESGAAVHPSWPPVDDSRSPRQRWTFVTMLLLAGVFAEAIFAGATLSGVGWARMAHAMSAVVLIASTVIAGLIALVTLRRILHGSRLGWILLSMAAVTFLQAALGALSAKGVNLLWVHVPLGAALVGVAGQTVASARRLGQA